MIIVPSKVISDNIVLSHELVKGYNRMNVSPRCMLKIDIQKAYDSVEWAYMDQILISFHSPDHFVKWIMCCLKIVSYSILTNGTPTAPFDAKKGLRQDDPMSPYLFVLEIEYLSRLLVIGAGL